MNNMKYEILLHVHAATTLNPARRSDFQKDTTHIVEYKICIKELIAAGYLSETIGSDVLSITTRGVEALEAEQERREKELQESEKEANENAKKERQQRFDNKVAIANLLVPIITFILGIFAEHYVGIVAFITGFFR